MAAGSDQQGGTKPSPVNTGESSVLGNSSSQTPYSEFGVGWSNCSESKTRDC